MKIAVMMRAMDQDSGFGSWIPCLIDTMLRIDHENSYLLLYLTRKWFGRFSSFRNVEEVLLGAPHKLIWDQVAVPYRAWKEGADVIFNPKFSVPLVSHCPVTMGLQEPAHWAWPQHYESWDVGYMKTMLPLYCRKAAHIFPNSNFILEENRKYLRLPFDRSTVTYSAPHGQFRPINDRKLLEEFRSRHQLRARFILSVTRVDHPGLDRSSSWHPGKNVETTLGAYLLSRDKISHQLVIAGHRVREYLVDKGYRDFEGVHFLDFVQREDMPVLYNLADLFVIPSFYEGCPNTLLEALACGCPIVASETGACPDVGGDAPLFANPYRPEDFAAQILSVLTNEGLRQELKKKSLKRAPLFSWEKTARLTLDALTGVVNHTAYWKSS